MSGMTNMIRLNGRAEALRAATILDLIGQAGLAPDTKGVAVARNGAVVPRARWADTPVAAGDEIDIIKAMAGG
jgi:sulfur carrier protein